MRYKNKTMYKIILDEINMNSKITEKELAIKYLCTERTIRRYIKDLKDDKKIVLIKNGKIRDWKVL